MVRDSGVCGTEFDPSVFNNDVAVQTAWTPLTEGGTNVRVLALKEVSPERVVFAPPVTGLLFGPVGWFMVFGMVAIIGMAAIAIKMRDFKVLLLGIVFGCVFCAPFVLITLRTAQRTFDTGSGLYWVGSDLPVQAQENDDIVVKISDIHAIQLLKQDFVSERKRHNEIWYSYELNLVLNNGTRVNVAEHGDLAGIRSDADTLAAFLTLPVWDAIDQ